MKYIIAILLTIPLFNLLPITHATSYDQLPIPAKKPSSLAIASADIALGLSGKLLNDAPIALRFITKKDASFNDTRDFTDSLGNSLQAALHSRQKKVVMTDPENAEQLITLSLSTHLDHLVIEATLTRRYDDFWSDLKMPLAKVVAQTSTNVAIDMELRALLKLKRRQLNYSKTKVTEININKFKWIDANNGPVLDIWVGDFDGDRHPEVALLFSQQLVIVGWAQTLNYAATTIALPNNPEAIRSRVAFGRLVAVVDDNAQTHLIAHSSALGITAKISASSERKLQAQRIPECVPLYATATNHWLCVSPPSDGSDVLSGQLLEYSLSGQTPTKIGLLSDSYDLRLFQLASDSSPPWYPTITAVTTNLALEVYGQLDNHVHFRRKAGVAHSLTDFEDDGLFELVTSSVATDGHDRLQIQRLRANDRSKILFQHRFSGSITAIECGDIDRDGFIEAIVTTYQNQRNHIYLVTVGPT